MLVEGAVLLLALAGWCQGQAAPRSPCPNVFMYEPTSSEQSRWYGVVSLSTDSTLHSLWLNVVLDGKADILGNWVGDVTTTDNIDFKIENTKIKIQPGPATAVRFFIQYNPLNKIPRVKEIRLNGREICNANLPQPAPDRPNIDRSITIRTVSKPDQTQEFRRPDSELGESRPNSRISSIRSQESKPVKGSSLGEGPVYVPTQYPGIGQVPVMLNSINGGLVPVQSIQTDSTNRGQSAGQNTYYLSGSQTYLQPTFQTGSQSSYLSGNPLNLKIESDFQSSQSSGRPGGQTVVLPSYQRDSQGINGYDSRDRRPTLTTVRPVRPSTRPDDDDYPDSKPDPDDYFSGPRPVLPFLKPNSPLATGAVNIDQGQCGKVIRNNPNPLVVNGKPTLEGQWPWHIALYQAQGVNNKYICGGTLVSQQHVVTAAHCVTLKRSVRVVNENTLTVFLGKHNLRTSIEGVQIRFVEDIIVHPQYIASSFAQDVGILKLLETVQYTEFVRPICLWPVDQVDLSYVIGKRGSVVGWGFNETRVATEELSLVEMPVVDQETCIRSYSEFFVKYTSDTTFCAGYRDGTSGCTGDSGGGMVLNMRGTWYLRGLVSLSVARQADGCDPSHYVVFTDLAKFLPWIKEVISSSK